MKKKLNDLVSPFIWKTDRYTLSVIDKKLWLYDIDNTYNDVLYIAYMGMVDKELDDELFWKIKITDNDRNELTPLTLIYLLSGGHLWKNNDIFSMEWSKICNIFLPHFEDRIMDIVYSSNTLGDLKNNIIKNISSEDIYELALELELINTD